MVKEVLRTSIIRTYGSLCKRLKVKSWQNYVFMSNAIEMMDELEKRLKRVENENDDLKSDIAKLKTKLKMN